MVNYRIIEALNEYKNYENVPEGVYLSKYKAGKMYIEELYSKLSYNYNNIKKLIDLGIYSKVLLEKYTEEELQTAYSFIESSRDFDFDYQGVDLLLSRYLGSYEGQVAELPQEMFLVSSLILEQDSPKTERMSKVKQLYDILSSRQLSLATPFLMNLRNPSGNLSSCFITAIDDNRESIFDVVDQVSAISKNAGGVGVHCSRIRALGATIGGQPNASNGVLAWIKIINDTAVAVNQKGKRKGAVTVALDVWHLDIEDFLNMQRENGDQRNKSYDVFPQVVVPDLFMQRVKADGDWLLIDPEEINRTYGFYLSDLWGEEFNNKYLTLENGFKTGSFKLGKLIKAKTLMKEIMKTQVETGMPYIAFKDALNRGNPNKHDGLIVSTNLCTESHSNVKPTIISDCYLKDDKIVKEYKDGLIHTCNLSSVNLAVLENDQELENVCRTAVRVLDNAIDFTKAPVLQSYSHNQRYRTIGVGVMGLADYLAKNSIKFTQSVEFVDALFEKIALYCIEESINIAKYKGTFGAYEGSDWDRGIILNRSKQWYMDNTILPKRWAKVFEDLAKYGIRNSQLMAIAPTTSTSILMGCTSSVLPVYKKFFIDNTSKGSIPNCPPFVREKLWYYQEGRHISQRNLIDVLSTINKWLDTGVSMELIFDMNQGLNAKEIYETIFYAWEKEMKTIYYIRSVQKDVSEADCESCAN